MSRSLSMKTLLSTSISSASVTQVIQRILQTGRITTADRRWLLKANTTSNLLDDEEIRMIKQVYDRLQMGLVKLAD